MGNITSGKATLGLAAAFGLAAITTASVAIDLSFEIVCTGKLAVDPAPGALPPSSVG